MVEVAEVEVEVAMAVLLAFALVLVVVTVVLVFVCFFLVSLRVQCGAHSPLAVMWRRLCLSISGF